ncbi:MAG: DUF2461 domain-containing protein [Flavobacteriales bacterium]
MKYFTPDFLQFFKDLAAHNDRDWFQANKKRYETSVKKPFEIFVTDLIKELAKTDKALNVKPSPVIFRINRDIRFSKDKSPYKLHMSAAVSSDGRKGDASAPGIYVELGPEKFAMAGGIYTLEKDLLQNIRQAIARDTKSFMKALDDKTFRKMWGDIQGEKNKVLPPELKAAAEKCPYIYNKQFYYWVELDSKLILGEKLLTTVLEYNKAAAPMKSFLEKAIGKK